MIQPSVFVLVFPYWEFIHNKQQTHLCQVSIYRKTNITWFRRIMMPQRRLYSRVEQLGRRKSAECEKFFNGNQSPLMMSSPVPGEGLSGESTPPSAQQWSLRLEENNCHCWRVIEKRGWCAPALLIGGYTVNFWVLLQQENRTVTIWRRGEIWRGDRGDR